MTVCAMTVPETTAASAVFVVAPGMTPDSMPGEASVTTRGGARVFRDRGRAAVRSETFKRFDIPAPGR